MDLDKIFEVGDRVQMTQTNNQGIVIDRDFNGYEGKPRSLVRWTHKDKNWNPELKDGWICNGNLHMSPSRIFSSPSAPS